MGKEVLTINRNYFRLRKPIERRIYEIARKHCGEQEIFKMSLTSLHKKTGSTSSLKRFRFNLRSIIEADILPDYSITLETNDYIAFRRRNTTELLNPTLNPSMFLKSQTLEKAKMLVINSRTGWDFQALKEEFIEFNCTKKDIQNIDGLFIGFIKNKITKCP